MINGDNGWIAPRLNVGNSDHQRNKSGNDYRWASEQGKLGIEVTVSRKKKRLNDTVSEITLSKVK